MYTIDTNNISTPLLKEFAEMVPGGFYCLDLDYRFVYINSFTLRTANANIDSVLGKTPLDIHPKEMAEEIIAHYQQVIKTEKMLHCEERVRDIQTGETKYFDVQLSPLCDKNKKIVGICGISTDVTDRKKLEQEILDKNKELESKDQLKKEFIKNFSHDVKLPINGIVGSTQLLQILTKDNPKIKTTAEKIDNGVMSLSKMFDHLYGVMVNDEFNSDIHNKDFSFQELLDLEIALTNSSIPPTKNINVSMTLDDKIPDKLCGDAFKTSQILRNILSNSVRYTKSGEIKLIVELLEDMPDKIKIKFTVSDTGTGITTTEKDKIYEYGRRFITSYESNIPGTGIGLNIVKGHVDALGGTIDYDSKIGEGSQFFVELTFGKV